MNPRFYFDVHVPRAVVIGLRMRRIAVLTAQEDESATLDDFSLLMRASELGRVLVSQDADLLAVGDEFRREGRPFAGIIYVHQLRATIGQVVEDLDLIASATSAEEWMNRIAKTLGEMEAAIKARSGAAAQNGRY